MTVDKGDTAWMLVSTILVLMMTLPGLALFYGGLVRTKNMLSILSQVLGITAVADPGLGRLGLFARLRRGGRPDRRPRKIFLRGIDGDSIVPTFTRGVGIPELVFVAFQMTFAAITASLIVGALAERVKFAAIMLFTVDLADHRLRARSPTWSGRRAASSSAWARSISRAAPSSTSIPASPASSAYSSPASGSASSRRRPRPIRSPSTLVGAGLLWVGWFGFNAGSALEASGAAAVAMINTFVAPAAGVLTWMLIERIVSGKPSLLGGASGGARRPRRGDSGGGHVGPARGDAARRRGRLRLLLVRRVDEAPAADRRHARRVRHPRPRRHRRLARHRDRHLADALGLRRGGTIRSSASSSSSGGRRRRHPLVRGRLGARFLDRASGRSACGSSATQEREGLDLADHGERAYNY